MIARAGTWRTKVGHVLLTSALRRCMRKPSQPHVRDIEQRANAVALTEKQLARMKARHFAGLLSRTALASAKAAIRVCANATGYDAAGIQCHGPVFSRRVCLDIEVLNYHSGRCLRSRFEDGNIVHGIGQIG